MTDREVHSSHVRLAVTSDIEALKEIEHACFAPSRHSSRQSLARSLRSRHQRVAVAVITTPDGSEQVVGAAVLFIYLKSVRLYSIGVLPEHQSLGSGGQLLRWTYDQVTALGASRLSLEVDALNQKLIAWYRDQGFSEMESLEDYYGPGEPALRMVRKFKPAEGYTRVALITESPSLWPYQLPNVTAITPEEYLSHDGWHRIETLRVINLCADYRDQSLGYYTSLLAAARSHRITPDVIAINDITSSVTRRRLSERYATLLQSTFASVEADEFAFPIIFEHAIDPKHHALAKLMARSLGLPLLNIRLRKVVQKQNEVSWQIKSIKPLSLREAMTKYRDLMDLSVASFFSKRRFQNIKLPSYRYDLAILVDPSEVNPPSCPQALQLIQSAAERRGFYVERITAKDRRRLPEFDALFIRATTAVNHATYRISREAITEGLIVIDDPWSILRCANKIFLYERLTRARVRQPRAWLFYANSDWRARYPELPFPIVIKRPEGCFSTGVFRAESAEELDARLAELFEDMDVVIGQEFLPSTFDWRIGILNHEPLFACKYYMATGHWQVYNWSSTDPGEDGFHQAGDSECVALHDVPEAVIQTAKRAASCIGNGLYGVDLKESGGKVYVIEVNDNPNIDAGIEDVIEGATLYDRLAEDFARRIELERVSPAAVR